MVDSRSAERGERERGMSDGIQRTHTGGMKVENEIEEVSRKNRERRVREVMMQGRGKAIKEFIFTEIKLSFEQHKIQAKYMNQKDKTD